LLIYSFFCPPIFSLIILIHKLYLVLLYADYYFKNKRRLLKEKIKQEKGQFNQEPSKIEMKNRKTHANHISLALINRTKELSFNK